MIDMFFNSVSLFLKGKLFKDVSKVFRQVLVGMAITAGICLGLSIAGIPMVFAVLAGALIGGAVQPWLFKDLKYA